MADRSGGCPISAPPFAAEVGILTLLLYAADLSDD